MALVKQVARLYDDFSVNVPDTWQANSQWYNPNGYVNNTISGGVVGMKMKAQDWASPSQGQFSTGNVFGWERARDLTLYARFKLTTYTSGSLNYNDFWIGFAGSTVAFSSTWFGLKSYWGTGFAFNAESQIGGSSQQATSFTATADTSWHEVWITCSGSSSNVTVKLDTQTVTLLNANLTTNDLAPSFWFWSNDSNNERGVEVDTLQVHQNRNWTHT
jgi:hypothetical protein